MGELSPQNRARDLLARIRAGELDPRPAAVALGLAFDQDEITAILEAASRSEAQPSGYDGLRQALAEAIEFAEQDWQALTPEGDAMLDRWRAALTFTASLSDASPKPSSDEQET